MVTKVKTAWMGKASGERRVDIREKIKRVSTYLTNPRRIDGTLKGNVKPKPVSLAKVTIPALLLFCGVHGPRALPKPAPNPQIEQDTWMQKWCETSKSGGYLCKEDR